MRLLRIVAFVIICLTLCCSSVLALEIVYPGDSTVIRRSDYLIIKGGKSPVLDAIVVDVNGLASEPLDIGGEDYRAAFDDFLILEPQFSPGKNKVAVKGYAQGKAVASAVSEFYFVGLDDPVAITPSGYKPFVLHTADKEALCVPCHVMQPSDVQLKNVSAEQNPCAACHKRMLEQEYVHGPEGVFQCVDCHDGKRNSPYWQVTKSDLTLCSECHVDKIEEYKKSPFVHGPVAAGECTICHNPHASKVPAQLNAPVNELCLGCHSDLNQNDHVVRGVTGKGHPLSKKKDPIRPGRELSCVSCHDPHSGEASSLFARRVKSRFSLCMECHKK